MTKIDYLPPENLIPFGIGNGIKALMHLYTTPLVLVYNDALVLRFRDFGVDLAPLVSNGKENASILSNGTPFMTYHGGIGPIANGFNKAPDAYEVGKGGVNGIFTTHHEIFLYAGPDDTVFIGTDSHYCSVNDGRTEFNISFDDQKSAAQFKIAPLCSCDDKGESATSIDHMARVLFTSGTTVYALQAPGGTSLRAVKVSSVADYQAGNATIPGLYDPSYFFTPNGLYSAASAKTTGAIRRITVIGGTLALKADTYQTTNPGSVGTNSSGWLFVDTEARNAFKTTVQGKHFSEANNLQVTFDSTTSITANAATDGTQANPVSACNPTCDPKNTKNTKNTDTLKWILIVAGGVLVLLAVVGAFAGVLYFLYKRHKESQDLGGLSRAGSAVSS